MLSLPSLLAVGLLSALGASALPTATDAAAAAVPTLVAGYSFIRAVAAPNFHKYLQSEIPGTASGAVLGNAETAALFKIVSGKLVQGTTGTLLYAVVNTASSAKDKLPISWSTSASDSRGTFEFSGDTVIWNDPSVTRPQSNAWLVCEDAQGHKDLYINLGPYGYMTPAGCADQTIHGYTGPYPDN